MATRTAKSRGVPRRSTTTTSPTRRPLLLLAIGGIGIIAIAAILAVVLASGASSGISEPATEPLTVEGGALPELPAAGPDPAIGMTIPRLVGTGLEGEIVEIGPGNGAQAIVVMAHWCPHCQAELPGLSGWLADEGAPDGVRIVTLSTAIDPARPNYPPSAWLAREGWTAPVLVDDAASSGLAALGLRSFPGFVFVNADGTVAARMTGEIGVEAFAEQVAAIAP